MIRYISAPDIHANPEWIETTELVLSAIEKAARKHAIDFVLFPGDLHDKNMYLSKEYNRFRDAIKRILAVCPIAAVAGTPGHETPAMYGPLEDLGLVLMRSGKVYGFTQKKHDKSIACIMEWSFPNIAPDCILFGIPEIIPSRLMSELGYSSIEDYIREYVAPMRLQFAELPAIGVMHGAVSDHARENEIDPKLKNAIHTDDMAIADLTRWELGHIHAPWESLKICAGYAGSWGINWGETGFVPSMSLIEIEEIRPGGVTETHITRIPYGTPMRIKIVAQLTKYDPDIAYWLCNCNASSSILDRVHPWSRITYEPQRIESRRITQEQAQGATLAELFKLNDPAIDAQTLELVKDLDKQTDAIPKASRSVSVDRVEIDGCIFFGGKSIAFEVGKLPAGLTQIQGANGEGKSSLAAFCTPYPVVVGKDTKSGRPSAIKDFFDQPTSEIRKLVLCEGCYHHHTITIKGAHTQSPKVECSIQIADLQLLDRGTFDEMMEKCEELYGSYLDYLLTTFYVQPLQGKTGSSLMSATMTDIRDLVQAIAGIDREREHRASLDRVAEYEKQLAEKESWLRGAEAFAVDVAALERNIEYKGKELFDKQGELSIVTESGKAKRSEYEALFEKQKVEIQEQANAETKRQAGINRNEEKKNRFDRAMNDYKRKIDEAQLVVKRENNKADNEYQSALMLYRSQKQTHETIMAQSGKVCEHCGKIPFVNQEARVRHSESELSKLVEPIRPEPKAIPETIDESLPVRELPETVSNLVIIETGTTAALKQSEAELETLRAKHSEIKESIATLEAQIKSLVDQIKEAEERRIKILRTHSEVSDLTDTLGRWKYISIQLSPKKIPAMELDLVAGTIDNEATRNLAPYHDGAYSFTTQTQRMGKKDIVDAFDIMVHDNSTGIEKSFLAFSPGQKAFLNDAYVKALIRIRNQRARITYSPIISDEADSPIEIPMIPTFYAMQEAFYSSERVLVISHTPDAGNYIASQVKIKDLIRRNT